MSYVACAEKGLVGSFPPLTEHGARSLSLRLSPQKRHTMPWVPKI